MSLTSPFNSLQENLTNSIRRAKQKIYSQSITSYVSPSAQSQAVYTIGMDVRQRTVSTHNSYNQRITKEEGNALASAMKTLQQKIAILEQEKKELSLNGNQQDQFEDLTSLKEEKINVERQLAYLTALLKEKESEVLKLNWDNSDLNSKNENLKERILSLQEQLQHLRRKTEDTIVNQINTEHRNHHNESVSRALLSQKDLRIAQLESQLKQSQTHNQLSHSTIEKLMAQLSEEKKINLRWIKLHEQQLLNEPQQQNSSLQANKPQCQHKGTKAETKKDYSQLLKNNKEMFETIQRNKTKMQEIGRQMKESEERYAKLKLLVEEIVDNVNKMLPHSNTHLRFLINRIDKLDHAHMQSLRSFSNHSRTSLHPHSRSKEKRKSLKMSDLNSSSKKSQQRSIGKSSSKKKRTLDQQLSHSQKKPRLGLNQQKQQIEVLQREVKQLKKQHRNLVVKSQKNSGDGELALQLEEVAALYGEKQKRLEELRVHREVRKELIL